MTRLPTFEREEVGGIRGLTSLTEPADDEPVGAIVDVAVIGARGDGKTQFIVHAIRTLRAYAPVLDGAEHQYNRDVLQVVMNAREPRPEATAPGVVPHYVFRIRPKSLLSQVGGIGRLALYARVASLWTFFALALLNAVGVGFALDQFTQIPLQAIIAASIGLFGFGCAVGTVFSQGQFLRRGYIELVFWDVAGEHVYSESAADYYSFLSALVRMRRQHASAERAYAFAPVLICNPLALGTRVQGSSYARLRKLIPLFASLNEPLARAMVAINRWTVVKEVCAPDSDRSEIVAVVPKARTSENADFEIPSEEHLPVVHSALPVVKRDVVRKHCLDAEDGSDNDVHFTYLRYDAGIQCEFHQQPWNSWDDMDERARSQWRAPTTGTPAVMLDYVYEDGPGSFEGDVRRVFLEWIASLAFHEASYGAARQRVSAAKPPATAERPVERKQRARPEREAAFVKARRHKRADTARRDVGRIRATSHPDSQPESRSAWRPRPLSARGLDEFARGTIAPDDLIGDAIDASLENDDAIDASLDEGDALDTINEATNFSRPETDVDKPAGVVAGELLDTRDEQLDEGSMVPEAERFEASVDVPVQDEAAQAENPQDQAARTDSANEPDAGDSLAARSDEDKSGVVRRRAKRGTDPGFGSLDDIGVGHGDKDDEDDDGEADAREDERPEDARVDPATSKPAPIQNDTLRMPRGFSSGGT